MQYNTLIEGVINLHILIEIILSISNLSFIFLYLRLKKKPIVYDNLELLSDLINNNRTLIEIKRISPGRIFLRSPRDL